MLVSQITPAATKIIQVNPYLSSTITGDRMIVACNKYVIGALPSSFNDEVVFNVRFGNIKYELNPDGSQGNPMLDIVIATRVTFNQSELSTWGTDDTVVHQLVLNKLNQLSNTNITIVSSQVMDMQHTA
jgi:hypothetical protein